MTVKEKERTPARCALYTRAGWSVRLTGRLRAPPGREALSIKFAPRAKDISIESYTSSADIWDPLSLASAGSWEGLEPFARETDYLHLKIVPTGLVVGGGPCWRDTIFTGLALYVFYAVA